MLQALHGTEPQIIIIVAVVLLLLVTEVGILIWTRPNAEQGETLQLQLNDSFIRVGELKAELNQTHAIINKLNSTKARKDREIKRLNQVIEDLKNRIGNLSSEKERQKQSAVDETGQPLRSGRLSDRPEVREAIKGEIADSSEPGNLVKDRLLPAERPQFWRQHTFKPHGTYGFIQYSGYRSGPQSFAAPGLHSKELNSSHLLQGCVWRGSKGDVQNGSLVMFVEGEEEREQYEPAVLKCELPERTSDQGGFVVATFDNEEFVMFVEESGKSHAVDPREPFEHQLAFCSTCFHDAMVPQHVWEFMEYHRALHLVDHFYLYDGGAMDDPFRSKVAPYVDAGMATITDIREILLFSVHYWGQAVAMADCTYRTRYSAKWLLMIDVDEYMHVKPPDTVQSVLAKYEGKAYLTHGMTAWDVEYCRAKTSEDQFIVERMAYRSPTMHCRIPEWDPQMCWDAHGHRKLFVDPRKVDMAQTHNVRFQNDGVHLRGGEDMWHYHFRGVGSAYMAPQLCNKSADVPPTGDYVYDDEMATIIPLVRQCPFGSERDCVARLMERQNRTEQAKT